VLPSGFPTKVLYSFISPIRATYPAISVLNLTGLIINGMCVRASTVFGRSNVEIAGSNPARGMDVCLRFYVLCCPV
jgi:hypothetical protein